jgi:[ribosomal protein S5]-alanine N-acetyltransferase
MGTADMSEPTVELRLATAEDLLAYKAAPEHLGARLSSSIPIGWPEFPEAIDFTLKQLDEQAEPSIWSMYFFLERESGQLVGSGGYAFPPAERVTEIGYEIAPEFRGKGFGTAAARELVQKAFQSGEIDAVIAHTLAAENPSMGVLKRLGFIKVAEQVDPDEGPVWEWRLKRT